MYTQCLRRAIKEIHRSATISTGQRLRCTQCPRVHKQQHVRVLLPPFPAIKRKMTLHLSDRCYCEASDTSHGALFACLQKPCLLKPRNKWQRKHSAASSSMVSPWSGKHLKKTPNQQCPKEHLLRLFQLFFFSDQHLCPWVQTSLVLQRCEFRLCCQSQRDRCVRNENFLYRFLTGCPTVQFSFYEFVTTSNVTAGLFTQISHHHWSGSTGAAVDDCCNVCPHLCSVLELALLGCQFFLSRSAGHIERSLQQIAYLWVARLLCIPSVFVPNSPRLGERAIRYRFLGDTAQNLPALVQNFISLPTGHTKQLVFAIVPGLVPIQLHGLLPELFRQFQRFTTCCNSWSVFHFSRHAEVLPEGSTRKSAAFCALHSSLLNSTLNLPLHQSFLPDTTKSSNSSHAFSRTGLASNSSAPSTSRTRDLASIWLRKKFTSAEIRYWAPSLRSQSSSCHDTHLLPRWLASCGGPKLGWPPRFGAKEKVRPSPWYLCVFCSLLVFSFVSIDRDHLAQEQKLPARFLQIPM